MVVTDCRPTKKSPHLPTAGSIGVGTVFKGVIAGNAGVFLRTWGGVVNLQNPQKTWSFGESMFSPSVQDYRPLRVELKILGDEVTP